MNSRTLTILLTISLGYTVLLTGRTLMSSRLPGDHQGYEPTQPIEYSHQLHAGELRIPCLYCHFGAEKSRHAGIPAPSVCMNCHAMVTSTLGAVRAEDEAAQMQSRAPRLIRSEQLGLFYEQIGLGEDLKADLAESEGSIEWVKVHNLPDFVYFDHRPHVRSGLECQACHGPIETMERVRQFESLSMGWCVNCHRQLNEIGVQGQPVDASIDCVTCHF